MVAESTLLHRSRALLISLNFFYTIYGYSRVTSLVLGNEQIERTFRDQYYFGERAKESKSAKQRY